jgi:peptidoglycan-N-acetylglucosamine deacetylase
MMQRITARLMSSLPAIMPGAMTRISSSDAVVVSFDDGPHRTATLRVIDALAEHKMRAVFFVTGLHAVSHPELVRACSEAGHSVQLHGWNHESLAGKTAKAIREDLYRAKNAVTSITGTSPRYFRPAYGRWNPLHSSVLDDLGLKLVLWNNMPRDFDQSVSRKEILRSLDSQLRGGDILVLHDNEKTADTIGELVLGLGRLLACKNLATTTVFE